MLVRVQALAWRLWMRACTSPAPGSGIGRSTTARAQTQSWFSQIVQLSAAVCTVPDVSSIGLRAWNADTR